jgi:hypothetical protein
VPGLVPGIDALNARGDKNVDGRDKPAMEAVYMRVQYYSALLTSLMRGSAASIRLRYAAR